MTSRDAEPTTHDDALSRDDADRGDALSRDTDRADAPDRDALSRDDADRGDALSRDDADRGDALSRDDALDRGDATTDDMATRSDDTMSGTSRADDASGTSMTGDTSGTSMTGDTTSGTSRTDESAATTTGAGTDDPEQLVPQEQVLDLQARWEVIQQGFVDDPRSAVSDADSLVDELLEKLSATFDEQQRTLEGQWNDGEPSTEDLRSALQRYRAFFNRLLTI